VRDITKRKEMEEQLIQASKMESVGRLAGGVAHDFNNILSAIIGYAEITLDEITEDNPLKKYIEIIYNSANRAANLTQQLLAFSRKQIIEPQVLNLNILIDNIQKMLSKLIGEDIEIKVIQDKRLWNVKVDNAQIEQIIINLAANARDAISRGGIFTIETANTSVNGKYSQDRDAVKPGKYVMLTISDTGCGMAEDVKERVFEPFFTTKKKEKSTGLGLSTVYGIVKQNNGNICVYSEPEKGTTFKIYLPRAKEEKAPQVAAKEESNAIPHGSETILVVEDDERVRNMTVAGLSRIGYTVLEAGDGEDALNIYNEFHKKIDLVLTDVIMPKMGGIEFAQKIRETCPEIKILYMSGYMENSIAQRDILKKGINFLQKPVKFPILAQAVRKTLNNEE
jgi:nitrogen-specific signal transduction histidine kinase/CheY-like chemotaxis protein